MVGAKGNDPFIFRVSDGGIYHLC